SIRVRSRSERHADRGDNTALGFLARSHLEFALLEVGIHIGDAQRQVLPGVGRRQAPVGIVLQAVGQVAAAPALADMAGEGQRYARDRARKFAISIQAVLARLVAAARIIGAALAVLLPGIVQA